jgi:hypothetical protein
MTHTQKVELWSAMVATVILAVAGALLVHWHKSNVVTIQGAVVVEETDPRKELPIGDVEITVENQMAKGTVKTDVAGFFRLALPRGVRRGDPVKLHFHHPGYKPLDMPEFVGDKLYIAHMAPLSARPAKAAGQQDVKVGNVRVRFSIKNLTDVNIGSAVKIFEIENKGNIPCKGQDPCSPDGKWKAAMGSGVLDAGVGNEFRNARASCIAGPCPFTKIEADRFSPGGQNIMVSARNWSDTVTFLLEAEVFHPMASELIHESYPVIFGESLNFTLPASAEGIIIEADIDNQTITFPLGPALFLSWADCDARGNPDATRVYRCQLKPGYRFQ